MANMYRRSNADYGVKVYYDRSPENILHWQKAISLLAREYRKQRPTIETGIE